MPAVATLLRKLLPKRRSTAQPAQHTLRVLRNESELPAVASLLARNSRVTAHFVRDRLARLFALGTSVLYVQIDGSARPSRVVFTQHAGNKVTASWRKGRLETELEATAPNGAYLTERQYRQLGFYEVPPGERAVVVLRFEGDHGPDCVIDVPKYIGSVSLVTNGQVGAFNVQVRAGDRLTFNID